jgi:hypothetical protein
MAGVTDLRLDADTHELIGPLGAVHLGKRLSVIMAHLLDRPGGMTEAELVIVVWADNPPADAASALRANLHNLRLALRTVTSRTVIEVSHPASVYALADAEH